MLHIHIYAPDILYVILGGYEISPGHRWGLAASAECACLKDVVKAVIKCSKNLIFNYTRFDLALAHKKRQTAF